jgi:hypothetical protein
MGSTTESAGSLSDGGDLPPLGKERLSANLAEYSALREEIKWLNQEAAQYQNFAIALLPVFVAAISLTIKSNRTLMPILLIAPVPFCILGLLYLRQRLEVQVVADYIRYELRDQVRQVLQDEDKRLWRWEEYKARRSKGSRHRWSFLAGENGILLQRALLFLLPGVCALICALFVATSKGPQSFQASFSFPLGVFVAVWIVNLIAIFALATSIVRLRLSADAGNSQGSGQVGQ